MAIEYNGFCWVIRLVTTKNKKGEEEEKLIQTYLQFEQPVFTFGRLLRPRFAGLPSSDFPEASLAALSFPLLEARDEESSRFEESEGIGDARSNTGLSPKCSNIIWASFPIPTLPTPR